jgi:hypothetical protein
MAKICPKCSADTDSLEEEVDDEGLCIHEQAAIGTISLLAVLGLLTGAGILTI